MGNRLLVTIGTEGTTNWVSTPDGQKFNLGPISALQLVEQAISKGVARRALDEFNRNGEVLVSVDEDRLWDLLAPNRSRWASDGCFSMARHKSEPSEKEFTMNTLLDDIQAIERHVAALDEAASRKATNLQEGVQVLIKLANKVKSPNQSKNETYYNLGTPEVFEVGDKVAGLMFDTHEANVDLANTILATAEATVEKIDALVTAGRRFNAAKAKMDVHAVTSKVAGILKTDLTASWVRDDLTKLADRANNIHALFANAK